MWQKIKAGTGEIEWYIFQNRPVRFPMMKSSTNDWSSLENFLDDQLGMLLKIKAGTGFYTLKHNT